MLKASSKLWPEPYSSPEVFLKRPRVFSYPLQFQEPRTEDSSTKHVDGYFSTIPSSPSPPPRSVPRSPKPMKEVKKDNMNSLRPVAASDQTSFITSTCSSPLETNLEKLKAPLEEISREELLDRGVEKQEYERVEKIKKLWIDKGLPNPEEWPRLKFIQNYDEDLKLQRSARMVLEDIKKFKMSQLMINGEINQEYDNKNMNNKDHKEAWAVIEECSSEDNRFEASELIEYKNHSWCVALRICREKIDSRTFQLLVYGYQCGIQRLSLTCEQIESLGETLLIKFKTDPAGLIVVSPIYSALPSTGLLSLKYRNNKGIELRVYGIVNFVDFEKDPDYMSQKTMIWTDAVGAIYLSSNERSNIRRKLMMNETKIFAPLRMCQLTVKGDFASNVANGTFLKWTVASFTPLIEETPKDPNIGRNLWPARVIRFDDLIKDVKRISSPRHFFEPINGTWLKSFSQKDVRVFAPANLTGILNSAGPNYAERGIMTAYVVPSFNRNKFVYYEALIAGPPRVVMIITEGRYLNYSAKTFSLSVQKMGVENTKKKERKQQVQKHPTTMKQPEYRMKSRLELEEFHFDFV